MPWIRGGAVNVTNGSTTVIGVNVDFAANAKIGDAFVGPDGLNYEVGNVASATVISIIPAYKGATAYGATYAIMPVQGYPKALADAFNNINVQWGGKLAALGTTGNYDTLPLNKGGTGIAVSNSTELLAGLGAMPTAGGSYSPVFNSLRVISTSFTAAGGGYLGWNENNGSGLSGAMSFSCNMGGGTGGFSWRTVNQNNTVGGPFMTYSYAGVLNVPTGLQLAGRNVVESGSNANGYWVRLADGTQFCSCTTGAVGATTVYGNAWISADSTWTFPAAFVAGSEPVVVGTQNSAKGVIGLNTPATPTSVIWARIAFFSDPTGRASRLMAFGRWY